MHPVQCTNTRHDITNLVNQGIVLEYLKSGSKHETCFYNYTF